MTAGARRVTSAGPLPARARSHLFGWRGTPRSSVVSVGRGARRAAIDATCSHHPIGRLPERVDALVPLHVTGRVLPVRAARACSAIGGGGSEDSAEGSADVGASMPHRRCGFVLQVDGASRPMWLGRRLLAPSRAAVRAGLVTLRSRPRNRRGRRPGCRARRVGHHRGRAGEPLRTSGPARPQRRLPSPRWVTAWQAAAQPAPGDPALAGATLRMIVQPAGHRVRRCGSGSPTPTAPRRWRSARCRPPAPRRGRAVLPGTRRSR